MAKIAVLQMFKLSLPTQNASQSVHTNGNVQAFEASQAGWQLTALANRKFILRFQNLYSYL